MRRRFIKLRWLFLFVVSLLTTVNASPASEASNRKLTRAQEITLTKAACPGAFRINGDALTCAVCPDGEPGEWFAGGFFFGTFLAPKQESVVISVLGCGRSTIDSEGAVILTRQKGIWTKGEYYPSIKVHDCVALRRGDGRDLLLCHEGFLWTGVLGGSLVVHDFAGGDPETLVSVTTSPARPCVPEAGGEVIDRYEVGLPDHEGFRMVTVVSSEREYVLTEVQENKCFVVLSWPMLVRVLRDDAVEFPEEKVGKVIVRRFQFDGEKFIPLPE